MRHNLDLLCEKFHLTKRTIKQLALLVSEGMLVPVSQPHTNIPEIVNRYAFVKDYYDYITANNMI